MQAVRVAVDLGFATHRGAIIFEPMIIFEFLEYLKLRYEPNLLFFQKSNDPIWLICCNESVLCRI